MLASTSKKSKITAFSGVRVSQNKFFRQKQFRIYFCFFFPEKPELLKKNCCQKQRVQMNNLKMNFLGIDFHFVSSDILFCFHLKTQKKGKPIKLLLGRIKLTF